MSVPGFAKDVLVSADWARQHLNDPNVRLVEVDVDTTAYKQSHIPGAVACNWTSQLTDGVRRDIAGQDDFSALLSKAGIGPETFVSAEVPETDSQSPNRTARSKCPTGGASVSGL